MKKGWIACAALASLLTTGCGPAYAGATGRPRQNTSTAGVTSVVGSAAVAGATVAMPVAGVAAVSGVSGGRAGAAGSGVGVAGGVAVASSAGAMPVTPTAATAGAGGAATSGRAVGAVAGTAPAPDTPTRSAGCGKPNPMTGLFQAQIRASDLDRGYYMSVPKAYDPARAYRLVFGFHGSNFTGKMMRQYLDNERPPLLDGTIFVYPDGLPLPNEPDNVAWVLDPNGRDIAFFDALLAQLRDSYCIDETRIFVNGQSFGALMTNFVGCLRGDQLRAIAVIAGSGPYSNMCKGKVAVWITHGMDDMSVPFKSGEASRDFWVRANGCSTMTVPGTPSQCQVYQGCDPEYPVIWCPHVNDGGHQEPSFGRAAVREFFASF